MSDGEIEVESPSGYAILPKEVTEEIGSIKLFNKWSYEDVEIRDISLTYGAPEFWRSPHCLWLSAEQLKDGNWEESA
jgi:hypothetical protein